MKRSQLYFVFAWLNVVLGMIGAVLPLMPTTIFLLIAAWSFSKSSPKWHQWLRQHPRFGEAICCWEDHHAMPQRAKYYAWATLAASYLFTAVIFGPFSLAAIIGGICIAAVALYIAHIPAIESKLLEKEIPEKNNPL